MRRGEVGGVCAGVVHLKATINLLKAAFNSCACSVSPPRSSTVLSLFVLVLLFICFLFFYVFAFTLSLSLAL